MMPRNRMLPKLSLAIGLPLLLLADLSPDAPHRLVLGRDAAAIIGAPLTPMSVAGVARRDTRRIVAVEATAATAAVATTAAATSAAAASQQQALAQQQAATAAQQQAIAQQQAATARQQAATAQQQASGGPAIGTIAAALPPGCTGTPVGGVEYYRCGNTWYRAAFQGNNLVYAVVPAP